MPPAVALKVDVDTFVGTRDGIPNLLRILLQFGIRATFYFSLGPDNSGKAIRRIFHRGFLSKMLRTRAPSMYGVRTLLYGTLLPAPMIGEGLPDVMRSVQLAGHEVGIHCWDHVRWHDYLSRFPKQTTFRELDQARTSFEEIFGQRARSTAAPGWTVSADSLEIQDRMELSHCSDARGTGPFFPAMAGRRFSTLQIPTTWPTMDELLGENGITLDTINDHYLQLLQPGLNVHTIHAELEGNALSSTFIELLQRLAERNVRYLTLAEVADEFGAHAPSCELGMKYIAGRAMPVAIQGAPIL
ncbi:MAG TPA: 4-deoxy-4-formamido-L-arabinose-phosphoundecaprenol deformylase [Desulfuromonadales bacterium]|nr:4-deoxy-4-formamido-L-arabinose-phosphoundecaprenol deformylase [Desulfuromonadales bacterium]